MAHPSLNVCQIERDKNILDFESIMSLPKSLPEAYKLHLKRTNHPAIKLFASSLQAHRSCNEAILFLYGVSGAGKSSTLNHLFSTDLIPTSATESATDSVTEWVSSMHSEHWRVSNLEVGFVDVPGWGDSEGRDATNFALMEQFLTVHLILGSKPRKLYPNIVLLVFNSNDNRILGSEANALRMLRTLSKLNIVDKKRPNVVIVLTHVCSHSKIEFSEKLSKQSLIYQNIARSCLGVNPPVVLIENNPTYQLTIQGDWTLLYDDTEQPLNLYKAIRDLMVSAGDEVGKEAIRLYFDSRAKNQPKERLRIDSNLCNKKMLTKLEKNWLTNIQSRLPSYKSTSLNVYLLNYLSSHPDMDIKEGDVNGLLLALANNWSDKSCINTKDLSVLECLLPHYVMSVKEKELLTKALELNTPKIPDCIRAMGHGYDMKNGTITPGHIIDLCLDEYFCSFLNGPLSKAFSLFPFEGSRISFGTITLDERRVAQILQLNLVKQQFFNNSVSLKCNTTALIDPCFFEIDQIIRSMMNNELVHFWIEAGLFNVQLNLPFAKLSKQFCDVITSLPITAFTENGELNLEFSNFFNEYGQFVIISANGGGIVEGTFNFLDSQSDILDFTVPSDILEKMESYLELLFDLIKDGTNWRDFSNDFSQEIFRFLQIPIHLFVATEYPQIAQLIKQALEYTLNADELYYLYDESLNIDSLATEMNKTIIKNPRPASLQSKSTSIAVTRFKKRSESTIVAEPSAHFQPINSVSLKKPKYITRDEVSSSDKTKIEKLKLNCFNSDSKVILKGGKCIKISQINIGDYVLSLNKKCNQFTYSKVYMWGHLDHDSTASFLEIQHEYGSIKLTENHLILHGNDKQVVTASSLHIGDIIHYFESTDSDIYRIIPTKVTGVRLHVHKGVYSPFTRNSLIIVDGVVCSVFAVPDSSVNQFTRFEKICKISLSPFIFISFIGSEDKLIIKSQNIKLHPYTELLLRLYHSVPRVRSYFNK
ncbi:hypothetical protein LOD99_10591 [Oopsacas minuta]|uniref:Hint domain-containing protein n=1 Tax=Oopsacas minuta TaxID=111878 RepID=A0AAV7KER3_9METZ|nr:hypothetical protein LOD99_10591 [Oopsacas minuta]